MSGLMSLSDKKQGSISLEALDFLPCDESDLSTIVAPALELLKKVQEEHTLDLSSLKSLLVYETKKELPEYTKLHLNGTLVGWYHLIDHKDYLELDDVNVLEDFQNLGIGTHILNRVKARAQEQNVSIRCQVLAANLQAIAFYERAEFKPLKSNHKYKILCWQSSTV